MKKPISALALISLAAASASMAAPAQSSYSVPNGWAPQPGRTKPSKASKTAKNRTRAKAAAKSRRQQRR